MKYKLTTLIDTITLKHSEKVNKKNNTHLQKFVSLKLKNTTKYKVKIESLSSWVGTRTHLALLRVWKERDPQVLHPLSEPEAQNRRHC